MSLPAGFGDAPQPIETARRNLLLLSATAVLGILLSAAVGLAGIVLMSRSLSDADAAAGALRLHADIDMMHDALRADVFTAASGLAFAGDDYEQHARLLEESVVRLYRMPLPPALLEDLRREIPRLRQFIHTGRELMAQGRPSPQQLEQFTARWRQLEAPLGAISDELRALVAQAHAEGQRNHTQAVVLIASAFLLIVTGVLLAAARLARAVLAAQHQLLEHTSQAVRVGRRHADFLELLDHEIRSPVASVHGLVDRLGREQLAPSQRGYVEALRGAGDRLLAVMRDLEEFARMEAGLLRIQQLDFSLSQVLEQVRRELWPLAQQQGIELAVEIDAPSTPVLCGDASRLQQVLLNLGADAMRFSAAGTVRIQARPRQQQDGRWQLRFEVGGSRGAPGAPAVAPAAVPDAADPRPTHRLASSGLGPVISRRLIEAMGGTMSQASGGGASAVRFELELQEGTPVSQAPVPLALPEAGAAG